MTACGICGGFDYRHDPVAHGEGGDEPCMCGTDFTCMADEHDREIARWAEEETA